VVQYANLAGRTVVQSPSSRLVDRVLDGVGTAAEASNESTCGLAPAHGWTLAFYLYSVAAGAATGVGIRYATAPGVGRLVLGVGAAVVLVLILHTATRAARTLRLDRRCHLTETSARRAFATARDAADRIQALWPRLVPGAAGRLPDILGDTLWRLAGSLSERQQARSCVARLVVLQVGLPDQSPCRAWIRDRASSLGNRLGELDTDITDRVDRLVHLADTCEQVAQVRSTLTTARRTVHDSDPDLTATMAALGVDDDTDATSRTLQEAYAGLAGESLGGAETRPLEVTSPGTRSTSDGGRPLRRRTLHIVRHVSQQLQFPRPFHRVPPPAGSELAVDALEVGLDRVH